MHISQLFDQDAKQLSHLVSLLEKEQSSLVDMDIDTIEHILDEKSTLIQKIAETSKLRHAELAKAGFDADENGMANWVRTHESEQAVWQTFQVDLEKAKELNRVNGQVINQHFKRNQQAISQLQGNQAGNNAGLYGANGQTSSVNRSRGVLSV